MLHGRLEIVRTVILVAVVEEILCICLCVDTLLLLFHRRRKLRDLCASCVAFLETCRLVPELLRDGGKSVGVGGLAFREIGLRGLVVLHRFFFHPEHGIRRLQRGFVVFFVGGGQFLCQNLFDVDLRLFPILFLE